MDLTSICDQAPGLPPANVVGIDLRTLKRWLRLPEFLEEYLHGLGKELHEVTVDTASGTSCYMRLKKNERYVIYGGRVRGKPDRVRRNVCSFSFPVVGNEMLLSAPARRGSGKRHAHKRCGECGRWAAG